MKIYYKKVFNLQGILRIQQYFDYESCVKT